jgi:hypothetical protein
MIVLNERKLVNVYSVLMCLMTVGAFLYIALVKHLFATAALDLF